MVTPRQLKFDKITVLLSFYCIVDRNLYDLGAVTMECDGRAYILDVAQSYTNEENNATTITCDLVIDEEVFEMGNEIDQCPYDLTEDDFYSPNFKATLYIGEEYEVAPESVSLFITRDGSTKAIDVTLE